MTKDKQWHVRHDDEVWTDDDEWVGSFDHPVTAEYVVMLHNLSLALKSGPLEEFRT